MQFNGDWISWKTKGIDPVTVTPHYKYSGPGKIFFVMSLDFRVKLIFSENKNYLEQ